MKKNGFTLIEMLGVITLLALISVIVVAVVDKSLKESKQTLYQTQLENIRSSANMWKADNILLIPEDGPYNITLKKLIDDGYIEANIINPITNKSFNPNTVISISMDKILIGSETGYNSIEEANGALINNE